MLDKYFLIYRLFWFQGVIHIYILKNSIEILMFDIDYHGNDLGQPYTKHLHNKILIIISNVDITSKLMNNKMARAVQ